MITVIGGRTEAAAQTTDGAIRGIVRDESGAVLPGATVRATSAANPAPAVVVTDRDGAYRLVNLAPGEYVVTAEHSGFAKRMRQHVGIHAGLNLSIDFELSVASSAQAVTVKAETPVIDTSSAGQAVNVSGRLQQSLPLALRKHWSEAWRLVSGSVSVDTPGDQASLFFVHGAGAVTGSIIVDGASIGSAVNPWTGYVAFPADTIADVQLRTSGLDALAPLGMGVAANVVLKSGTNLPHLSLAWAYTAKSWVGINAPDTATSQTVTVNQPEAAIGGPLVRDRWWLYGSYQRRTGTLGLSRSAAQVADMKALAPTFTPFDNKIGANIALVKITGRLSPTHQLSGFVNSDTTPIEKDLASNTGKFTRVVTGGHAVSARLTSGWSSRLMSRLAFSWNDKGSVRSLVRGQVPEPSRPVFQSVIASGGVLTGSPQAARAILDNTQSETQSPYNRWTITGDVTFYRTGWLGSHEFQAGMFLEPNMHRRDTIQYANGGFALEELTLRWPADATAGTIPFHRRVFDAAGGVLAEGHFSDNAVYAQDTWRPSARLTINLGLRIDRIGRVDDLFDVDLQKSTEVGPRLGVTYVLTSDRRNILRASFMRLHDAPSINQLSASGAGTQGAGARTIGFTDTYDVDLDGVFETIVRIPAATAVNPSRVMDADYHQPFVDEWAAGFRRQLPADTSLDVGFIHRDYRHRTAFVQQNGMYDGSRFLGYENGGSTEIFLVTNNRWNWPVYNAIELSAAKRTGRIQMLGTYTRVWSHLAGTWQPNDPASFIQPEAFAFGRGLSGNDNRNPSLNNGYGSDLVPAPWSGPEWIDHVANVSVVYSAPWKIVLASSYSVLKGWWSGPILRSLAANDPQFGPARIVLPNGAQVPNPLATTLRFVYATRSDGQAALPARHHLNLRVGREFQLGPNRRLQVDLDVFNVPNLAGFQGFVSGANRLGPDFGKGGNVQPPRTVQLNVRFAFDGR